MRRTSIALLSALLLAGGTAACGKSEPAPAPPTPAPATAAPAQVATPPAGGDEENQPRRGIEPAVADDGGPGTGIPAVAGELKPVAGGDQDGEKAAVMAAAKLTAGPAVDLGAGPASARALAFLPDTTVGLFVVRSPQDLLARIGFVDLKAQFAEKFAPLSAQLVEATGHDLLDPAAWGELGLDLAGPAGNAMVLADGEEAYVIFMTAGDRAKLDLAIAAAGEKGKVVFERELVGDAELIAAPNYDRNVIVLRGNSALVVGVDRETGARALARRVALQEAATSLAQAVEFTSAVKGLDVKEDALVWGNLGLGIKLMTRSDQGGGARAEAERVMAEKIVGPLTGFAMGATIKDSAVEVSTSLPLPADAFLRRLFVNLNGLPATFTASAERPLFAMAGRIDPKVLLELAEASLAAEGENLDEVRAAAKEMGGVDLDRDVFGLFSGEVGFVITGDLERATKDGDLDPRAFGGAVVIGLANAEGLKKLFGIAANLDGIPKNLKIDPAGTLEVPLPGGAVLHVQIAGDALIASTDPAFAKRVAAGDTSASFVAALDHPDLKALLSRPNQAAWSVLPIAVGSFWLLAGRGSDMHAVPSAVSANASPERVAKEKELAAARAKLELLRDKHEAQQQADIEKIFGALGVSAATLEVTEGGLRGHFGQYFATPIPELVRAIATSATAERTKADELEEAYDQVFKLDNEVRDLELKEDMAKPE